MTMTEHDETSTAKTIIVAILAIFAFCGAAPAADRASVGPRPESVDSSRIRLGPGDTGHFPP